MNRTFSIALSFSTALLLAAGVARVHGQGSSKVAPPAETQVASPAQTTKAKEKASKRLSADQAYKVNCTRCHSELPKLDARAMKTVMMHMQVRANLPKDEARAILDYLTR